MKALAIALCCVAASLASPLVFNPELDEMWTLFQDTHSKNYEKEVVDMRRFIWERNLHMINQHNIEADMGKHTYKLGMNEYGDLVSPCKLTRSRTRHIHF
jgi:hypothetical protein